MRFTKAHGIGNDFIIVAEADLPSEWASWAIRLCDRNRGIGGDGILIVGIDEPARVARMKLLNADGTLRLDDAFASRPSFRCGFRRFA